MQLPYDFHEPDMCQGLRASGKDFLAKFIGQPCRLLEIGVWDGRSGCWLLDNILTHPESRYVGVDLGGPHKEAVRRGQDNIDHHGLKARVLLGDSIRVLASLVYIGDSFDVIHVDGGHDYDTCRADLLHSWLLLKKNGVLIVDDYLHEGYGVERALKEVLGKMTEGTDYRFLYRDYLIALEKLT